MDRAQFMEQLERLLSDISEAERQEAPGADIGRHAGDKTGRIRPM